MAETIVDMGQLVSKLANTVCSPSHERAWSGATKMASKLVSHLLKSLQAMEKARHPESCTKVKGHMVLHRGKYIWQPLPCDCGLDECVANLKELLER